MKKKIISFALIIGVVFGVIGCGNNSGTKSANIGDKVKQAQVDGDLETVRLGVWTGGIDHYLAEVGTEKGIFEKHGIDLQYTEFAAGINTIDAIVTGQSDLGMIADYAGVNRIGNTQEDFNVRIIGRYVISKGYSLYVNPKEVTKLEDLAGKGVATNPGTILDYYNALTYEKANIKEKDQNIVNIDSGQALLSVLNSGDAVAYWTTGTTAKKLEEMGMKKFLNMDDLGLSVESYFVSADTFIKDHEDTLEDFLSAMKETEEWVLENQAEAAEIVEEKISVPKEQVIQNLQASELVLDFKGDSVDHLNEIKSWAVKSGLFEKDYEIKDFVDTTALKKLFPNDVEY
ncbi:MAG: ABC transporter substrate-binding protein [Lachnospiraceae bacterium]